LKDNVKKSLENCNEQGASRVITFVKNEYKKTGVTIDEKVEKYRK